MSFLCLPPPSRRESFNSEVMATFLVRVATAMIRQHYQKQVGKERVFSDLHSHIIVHQLEGSQDRIQAQLKYGHKS